jgi:integrase
VYYFGRWGNPEGALQEYLAVKDDLYAGRTPTKTGGITLRELCNAFISTKRAQMDAGQLSPRTFVGYDLTCKMVRAEFGLTKRVLDLCPSDFEKLYFHLSEKHGVATLAREIVMTKSVFKYAYESDLIEKPVKFGPMFKGTTKQNRKKDKNKAQLTNGKKLFSAADIKRLIDTADLQLKAMILLGINCGFGNTDCASLPISALNLKTGWLDFPRPKTGIHRRIPLWPETVAALQEVIEKRKMPVDEADAGLVFVTRCGLKWVRFELTETKKLGKKNIKTLHDNALSKAFAKLLDKLDLKRYGVAFYALRHTFETVAGGSKDQAAVDAIMGHSDSTMAAEYQHGIEDSRLRAVTNHVHVWMFEKDI